MKLILTAIVVIIGLFGCASRGSFNLTRLETASSISARKDDITIFIKPITDSEQLNNYFGDNLFKCGVLPIQVRILNDSKYDIGVSVDNFKLHDQKSKSYDSIDVENIYNEIKSSQAYVLFDIPIVLLTGVPLTHMGLSGSNTKTKTNLMVNLFKNGVIPRRESAEGIVYMRIPEEIDSLSNWMFSSTIFKRDNDESITLTAPL